MNRTATRKPRLSIILVTKNRAALFARSIASIFRVVEEDSIDAEIIVIDGGSTDGTGEILKRYESQLAYWVSEPDSGSAEAVNKGIAQARCEILRLVGDDDECLIGGLSSIMKFMDEHPEYDVVAGHNIVWDEEPNGRRTLRPQERFVGEVGHRQMAAWGKPRILIPEVCFFRRRAFDKAGVYDRQFRWWGFLDLFFRMINVGIRIYVVPLTILATYQAVQSDTRSNLGKRDFHREFLRIIREKAGLRWALWHRVGGSISPTAILVYVLRPIRNVVVPYFRKIV